MILHKLDFDLQNKIRKLMQDIDRDCSREVKKEMAMFYSELCKHISFNEIEKLAKETKFVQRKSKFTDWKALWLCAFSEIDIANDTLLRLASKVSQNNGPIISSQGLDQRLNMRCSEFLKGLMNRLLKTKISEKNINIPTEIDNLFKRIRILDSTAFQLPEEYKDTYPGSGGCAQKAGGKIQLEFELKSGEVLNVDFGAGSNSDNTFGTNISDTIERNDLILRDLGYFSIEEFNNIKSKNAFYISRLKPNIAVYLDNQDIQYHKNGNPIKSTLHKRINLIDIMHEMNSGEMKELEDVIVGREKQLRTRVILYKLTEKQLKERKKQAAYRAKKKGITPSENTTKLLGLTMYITNIPKEMLDKHKLYELYTLRWQVELIFKTWKSTFKIHNIKKVNIDRFRCHIYGKLILVILSTTMMFKMRNLLLKIECKEASEIKLAQIVREYISSLYLSYIGINSDKHQILITMYLNALKNARKSRRKGKKTYFEILGVQNEVKIQKNTVTA